MFGHRVLPKSLVFLGGFLKVQNIGYIGTSLVGQWLRLPMQGTWVRSLIWELDPACHN